tara:strand:- start:313 stop:546 length:234 start_codon:yes stop_codon:yes gene_type:complete
MESRKNKEKTVNSLSDADKAQLELIINRLSELKETKPSVISEDSVKLLEFTILDLFNMYAKHQKLLQRWLKQGYMID